MPFSRESALNGTSLALTILTGLGSLVFIGAGMLASRAPYLEYILDVTKSIPTSIDMLLSTSLYTIPADFNRGMIESSDLGWWLIGAGNVLLVSTFPSFLAVSTGVRRRGAKKGNNFSPVVDADAETEAPKPFVNPARKRRFLEFALLFIALDLFVAGGAASYALVRVNFNRQQLSGLVARQMDVVPQLELLMMQIDNKCCGFQQGVIADGTVALGDVLSIMQETFAGNANITDQMAVTIEDRFLGTSVNPCETEAKVKSMPACYEMVKSSVDMQFMAFIGILAGMSLILIANLAINIVLYRQARALPTEPTGPNGTAMAKLEEDFESMKEPADYPPPASKKVIRTTTASQPGAAAPPVYEEKQ